METLLCLLDDYFTFACVIPRANVSSNSFAIGKKRLATTMQLFEAAIRTWPWLASALILVLLLGPLIVEYVRTTIMMQRLPRCKLDHWVCGELQQKHSLSIAIHQPSPSVAGRYQWHEGTAPNPPPQPQMVPCWFTCGVSCDLQTPDCCVRSSLQPQDLDRT